jgi:DNA helicase-2/ATP-dependent DNA helicase PcrA
MRNRLDNLVGLASKLIWICTFHSACVRILRRDVDKLGYGRNFTIFDTSDQLAVMRKVMEELQLSERSYNPRSLLGSISNAKNALVDHVEYANSASSFSEQITSKVYREYQAYLKENNALDFDYLIMFTVNLLQKFPEVLEFYQDKFRYILVDEYQDTNHSQYMLTKMLAAKHKNICVGGDADQCLPAGTLLKTPHGGARVADLHGRDLIVSASGRGKTLQVPIIGIHRKEYEGKIITIKTKTGTILRATPNHMLFARLVETGDFHYV